MWKCIASTREHGASQVWRDQCRAGSLGMLGREVGAGVRQRAGQPSWWTRAWSLHGRVLSRCLDHLSRFQTNTGCRLGGWLGVRCQEVSEEPKDATGRQVPWGLAFLSTTPSAPHPASPPLRAGGWWRVRELAARNKQEARWPQIRTASDALWFLCSLGIE